MELKEAELENRNLKLETRKNITAMRREENANARSEATGSVLSVHDSRRATEDKEMRSIFGQRKAVAEEYARLSPHYDQKWSWYAQRTHQEMLKQIGLRDGDRVLDLGCGTGSLFPLLAERGAIRLFGADLSFSMLKYARKKDKVELSLVQAAAEQLPCQEDSFDVVVSCSAFHYFPAPVEALREVRRVLKVGGSFCCTDWCADFWTMRLFRRYQSLVGQARIRLFRCQEWVALLKQAGFVGIATSAYKAGWLWGMVTVRGKRAGKGVDKEKKILC